MNYFKVKPHVVVWKTGVLRTEIYVSKFHNGTLQRQFRTGSPEKIHGIEEMILN